MAKKVIGKKDGRATTAGVRYRIEPADPNGHHFQVECVVEEPDGAGQVLALPAWIPGSYMIREFARNIVEISARCGKGAVALVKEDKHTWRAAPCVGPLRLFYRIYAWDPSVRAAHLDDRHAFFNGTSVFLRVEGREHGPHAVELAPPRGKAFTEWRVATTLPALDVEASGFGLYGAHDYDALIDHPVEMGTFRLERFESAGVPHAVAWTCAIPNFDAERVNRDLAVLCAAQIRFFRDAPFDRFLFLTTVSGDGYGGLEHRASTALVTTRDALPVLGQKERSTPYLGFLGLASHEYFHSWNVKRIKPAAFVPYRLDRENYTSLLWIFEGFTSYYDDLFLVRTGLATTRYYYESLARTVTDVMAGVGRHSQSVAESSFDAWTKYYRQDENAANAIVSYYKKGSLVGLCLDLVIRVRSDGKRSLDDVMRLMWQRFGAQFDSTAGTGVDEGTFPALVAEATGVDVRDEVERWAYGTDELPLAELLQAFGIDLHYEPQGSTPSLGARVVAAGIDSRLATVDHGGPAHAAGLSAGDVLVAIDGVRTATGRVEAVLGRYRAGDRVEVAAFRGDLLQTRVVTLGPALRRAVLEDAADAKKSAVRRRGAWLTA